MAIHCQELPSFLPHLITMQCCPSQVFRWEKQFFDGGAKVFDRTLKLPLGQLRAFLDRMLAAARALAARAAFLPGLRFSITPTPLDLSKIGMKFISERSGIKGRRPKVVFVGSPDHFGRHFLDEAKDYA